MGNRARCGVSMFAWNKHCCCINNPRIGHTNFMGDAKFKKEIHRSEPIEHLSNYLENLFPLRFTNFYPSWNSFLLVSSRNWKDCSLWFCFWFEIFTQIWECLYFEMSKKISHVCSAIWSLKLDSPCFRYFLSSTRCWLSVERRKQTLTKSIRKSWASSQLMQLKIY